MTARALLHKTFVILTLTATLLLSAGAQTGWSAVARIPFDFFVESTRMPRGDYTISSSSPTILLFYNKTTKNTQQAFTGPAGPAVQKKDAKIVFVLFEQQYRFVGLRGIHGTWRTSADYLKTLPQGAKVIEIPVTYVNSN